MENRAEERRNAGSFAWLESKEAERRAFFLPRPFEARGSVANHTHCWKTTVRRKRGGKEENKDWRRGKSRKKKRKIWRGLGWRGEKKKKELCVSPRC